MICNIMYVQKESVHVVFFASNYIYICLCLIIIIIIIVITIFVQTYAMCVCNPLT